MTGRKKALASLRTGLGQQQQRGGGTPSYSIYVTRQNMPVPLQNETRIHKSRLLRDSLGVAQEHVQ